MVTTRSQEGFQKELIKRTKQSSYQFYAAAKIIGVIKNDLNIVRL